MNERLKELAKQRAWHAGGGIVSDLAVDVIAELIVREYTEKLVQHGVVSADGTIVKDIQKHFGVKE
jgi:hypothetical protein